MSSIALLLAAGMTATPVLPQSETPPVSIPDSGTPPEEDEVGENGAIVADDGGILVVAERPRGGVETDIAPVAELNSEDIAAYGASSVGELIEALGPEVGSGRGRGGGHPIILVNGRRINDFREMRNIPPEAIERVQVFPEEVAIQYGYRPDQRVVNLILQQNFASAEAEIEVGAPTEGGFWHQEYDGNFTRIGRKSRLNAHIEYAHDDELTEAERGITRSLAGVPFTTGANVVAAGGGEIDPALSAQEGQTVTVASLAPGLANPVIGDFAAGPAPDDVAAFRSLRGRSSSFSAEGSYSQQLSETTDLSISASHSTSDSESQQGLPGASLTVAAGNPNNPFANDVVVSRYLPTVRGGLMRKSTNENNAFSLGLNGLTDNWRWAVNSNLNLSDSSTRTEAGYDVAAIQAAVDAGTFDPFTDTPPTLYYAGFDQSDSNTLTADVELSANKPVLALPAGDLALTLTTGAKYNRIESQTFRARTGTDIASEFDRRRLYGKAAFDIPIADDRTGLGEAIGRLSLNANFGYDDLDDFGGLLSYGGGLTWAPAGNLSLSASYIGNETAPSLTQLGAPIITTPNVTIYDYTRGESVLVDYTTGGNPNLAKESQGDIKATLSWEPKFWDNFNITAEYLRNRSDNVTAGFPLLTPDIEAAFPGRVTRNGAGQIVAIDARPVTFAETRSDTAKLSLRKVGSLGKPDKARKGGGRGGPAAMMMGRGRGGAGRYFISLSYEYRLRDEVLIGDNGPLLDLLGGDATGSSGGTARHKASLEAGLFKTGKGLRLSGNYESGSRVDGDPLTGSTGLDFGPLATLDARIFLGIDDVFGLTESKSFFKNSRVSFAVKNVFDSVRDVRDDNGLVPLTYQPGYLDPLGRYIEVDFRKRF